MIRNRAVAVVIKDEKILLMHRISSGKEYYVFPGGGVEDNETIEEATLREIMEEASLEIKLKKLVYHNTYDDGSEQFFYLCEYISGEPKIGDLSEEALDMAKSDKDYYNPIWFEIKKLPQLLLYPLEVRDQLIEDIKTNFENTPKEESFKISELRQSL
jgi:8-oxo-dGTP diphosphatase